MRVRIIFSLKNRGAYLPFHHQYILAQLVKGILLKGGKEDLFDYSFYNFSGLKGQTKVSRNGLHYYSSRVTLVLSSINEEFIDYFVTWLFKFPKIELGNLILHPESVEKEQTVTFENETKFICISPLVLTEPDFQDIEGKKFLAPESDQFSDMLFDSTIYRMEKFGYSPEELAEFYKFQVVPDEDYLTKIKQKQKKFARIYPVFENDVRYEVRGYTFPFTLYAAPEVQRFVFNCGMGAFSHKGFGMLDLANSNPAQRTAPYALSKEVNSAG